MVGLSQSWIARNGELAFDGVVATCVTSASSDPAADFVADQSTSTFGAANRCGDTDQDLAQLRQLAGIGDANCDGAVTPADARAVLEYTAGTRSGSDSCPLADPAAEVDTRVVDLSGDGQISLLDALLIARCVQDPASCESPG